MGTGTLALTGRGGGGPGTRCKAAHGPNQPAREGTRLAGSQPAGQTPGTGSRRCALPARPGERCGSTRAERHQTAAARTARPDVPLPLPRLSVLQGNTQGKGTQLQDGDPSVPPLRGSSLAARGRTASLLAPGVADVFPMAHHSPSPSLKSLGLQGRAFPSLSSRPGLRGSAVPGGTAERKGRAAGSAAPCPGAGRSFSGTVTLGQATAVGLFWDILRERAARRWADPVPDPPATGIPLASASPPPPPGCGRRERSPRVAAARNHGRRAALLLRPPRHVPGRPPSPAPLPRAPLAL